MKKAWQETLYAIWMGMAVPGLILAILVMFWEKDKPESNTEPETLAAPVSLSVLVRWPDEGVEQMDMDEYLTGVVLAEMPAFFEPEALKAQAVAARTYARKAAVTGGKHGDGSVCTDYTCCQAYLSPEEYLEKGGIRDDIQKVRSAVLDTSGYVLTYNGELIEAVYFSCSGEKPRMLRRYGERITPICAQQTVQGRKVRRFIRTQRCLRRRNLRMLWVSCSAPSRRNGSGK